MKIFMKIGYVLFLLLLAGCYPKGPELVEEMDIVGTSYNKDFDFTSVGTFSIPDSIIKITDQNYEDGDGDNEPEFVDKEVAAAIIDNLKRNLESYGWQEAAKEEADVLILPSVFILNNVYYYYDWGYWGWWYPGYYPGWGWWYPYPVYPSVSSYETGTLLVQMTYPEGEEADNIPVEWNAVFNGLVRGSQSNIISRTTKAMDRAFTQSPYLNLIEPYNK